MLGDTAHGVMEGQHNHCALCACGMTVMMMLGVKTTMMTRTQTANMKVTICRHAYIW